MKVLNRQPKKGHFHLNYERGNFVYESTLTSGGRGGGEKTLLVPRPPTMQADSLPAEPPGKPICISKFYQISPRPKLIFL